MFLQFSLYICTVASWLLDEKSLNIVADFVLSYSQGLFFALHKRDKELCRCEGFVEWSEAVIVCLRKW